MAPRLPSDETSLVRMAAACSQEAFAALAERFHRLLRLIVMKYADVADDRDDLEADVVAKLLRNRKRALRVWRPRAPFGAYLLTIAARHCIQWAQRDGRLRFQRLGALPGQEEYAGDPLEQMLPAPDSDDPALATEVSFQRQAVCEALARLSADDQLALALRFEEEMKSPAIGRFFHISPGAARQRVFKALRRLERVLAERSPEVFEPAR